MKTGVSFVVPVYDKAPWLPGVLERLAAQRGDFDREYIFVDDGSTDGSLAILKARTAGWPDTTILEQANHGVAHATNRGLARARMPFIKFCDADDLLVDGATQALLDALTRGGGATTAFGRAAFYDDGAALDFAADLSAAPVEAIADPRRLMIRSPPFSPVHVLVRTDAARAAGGCDERFWHSQDYTLGLRLAFLPGSVFLRLDATVAYVPRVAPGRLSADVDGMWRDITGALERLVAERPDMPRRLRQYACYRAAGRAWRHARRRRAPGRWRWLLLRLRSLFPIPRRHAAGFIARCGALYEAPPRRL